MDVYIYMIFIREVHIYTYILRFIIGIGVGGYGV